MCLYRYVYYSRCQHSELVRLSYCDSANALTHPERDMYVYASLRATGPLLIITGTAIDHRIIPCTLH